MAIIMSDELDVEGKEGKDGEWCLSSDIRSFGTASSFPRFDFHRTDDNYDVAGRPRNRAYSLKEVGSWISGWLRT
jgi:hypothetical protein